MCTMIAIVTKHLKILVRFDVLAENWKTYMFVLSYLTKKVGYNLLKKVTKIFTVCEIFNETADKQEMFSGNT